jgi:hypothetical protein
MKQVYAYVRGTGAGQASSIESTPTAADEECPRHIGLDCYWLLRSYWDWGQPVVTVGLLASYYSVELVLK